MQRILLTSLPLRGVLLKAVALAMTSLACLALALGLESLIIRSAPPLYASVGQMIVNVKLNIQQQK